MVPFCGDDTKFEVFFTHQALTYDNLTQEISVYETDKAFEGIGTVIVVGTVYKMGVAVLSKEQQFDVNINFPKNYYAPVLRKEIPTFRVEVNSTLVYELPEIID